MCSLPFTDSEVLQQSLHAFLIQDSLLCLREFYINCLTVIINHSALKCTKYIYI